MVKKLLWLDDSRDPFTFDWLVFSPIKHPFQTFWVQSYDEFIKWIMEHGVPDAICFDHDLGTESTGYDAVKWLCEYCREKELDFPTYAMQSANPIGRENMRTYIENYKKHYTRE
jgi:hypothetical protein